jgi:hypothetical protein
MLSRSDARTEVFSKLKVNGAGGLRIPPLHSFGVLVNIVELSHVEHKSRFRIGDLLSTSIARRRAMNINLTMNTDLAGIRIPTASSLAK